MDRTQKQPGAVDEDLRKAAGVGAVAVGVPALTEVAGVGAWLAPVLGGPAQDVPLGNPFALYHRIFATHELVWSGQATAATVALGVAACGACAGAAYAWRRFSMRERSGKPAKQRIDAQAKYLAHGRELADLERKAMTVKAGKLGVALSAGQSPGVLIGRTVIGAREIFGSFEDLHLDIWGPRQGKSTSRVIPAVIEHIGPVVATSNKRDVVDATRAPRSTGGRQVHVFDPQGVAGEVEPSWYWDPIAWVAGKEGGAGAAERAAELAGHFAAGDYDGKGDAFFEPEGEELLAGLILAAALAKRPITQVFSWVTNVDDRSPSDILARHGARLIADALADQYNAPDKQRGGVFSTAKKMASCLKYERIRPWVCPPEQGEAPREAFDVDEFVQSNDTLYPLSEEGKGSAGPLITALCAAVAAAGKRLGIRHGGRMPVPLLIVLDEAANIVRWAELPKQYSHFGSRGIVVMTILQSWAQGVRCWGRDGMDALWSASTVKVLGPGLDDYGFLRDRSEVIGPHYELATSVSQGSGSRSTSTSRTSEITLHASDLAALPKGRAVIFTAGHRPTLVAMSPWFERSYAQQVQDSIDDNDPSKKPLPEPTDHQEGTKARLRSVPAPSQEDAA
ncbi:type IV secretory system conjugative DNA transfer family protein [Nocardia brasiliensis]|uniref:type IV secretory system conjugative DNA transfer family protein n=1 Tax=Nocardia brasiliensis TaxID=37326 RepID=UPI0033D922C8